MKPLEAAVAKVTELLHKYEETEQADHLIENSLLSLVLLADHDLSDPQHWLADPTGYVGSDSEFLGYVETVLNDIVDSEENSEYYEALMLLKKFFS